MKKTIKRAKKVDPTNLAKHLREDRWTKVLVQGGSLKATAITANSVVKEALLRHGIQDPAEGKTLGEALVAVLLLASRLRPGSRVSLSIKGSKEFKQAFVDANTDGEVRGFISRPTTPFKDSSPSQRGPWGEGFINVSLLQPKEKEPYVGTCELATGHLAKDLTVYLIQSEQIPSAMGLFVDVSETGEVIDAGGFIIEVLPNATEEEIASIEQNLTRMEDLAREICKGSNPTLLLSNIFSDQGFSIIDSKELKYSCTCSKDKVGQALTLFSPQELQDMMKQDKGAHVKCDFCGRNYLFTENDLQQVLAHAQKTI